MSGGRISLLTGHFEFVRIAPPLFGAPATAIVDCHAANNGTYGALRFYSPVVCRSRSLFVLLVLLLSAAPVLPREL